ncbi:M14 family metallopeptidase [Flavobacterium sp. MAH-1]|uniref:M14 family metallopeptidase n=1 Tax=Flavobacterium agri TaxID=2743471 RepID=A0A7Y9C889_9FLAO|nr:M14 family metallopeptidase [Flavobacterium agri]NUY82143.1 M14 family metallopeptidase [Flavobacterium agri]NYA72167.1 M14 family metallopeptidase [Flavobacterium agri]
MKNLPLLLFVLATSVFAQKKDFKTPFEKGNGNQSATYDETVAFYNDLAANFETISINDGRPEDSGEILQLIVFDPDKIFFDPEHKKTVILINNGIHAGEPDGIDATMMLFRDLATGKIKTPKNTIIATIPVYNIGGMLNRNSTTRINQDGPEQYGFRGNSRNYDLNRDFIKADTGNTWGFARFFQLLDPEIFIDNHVSNGADYQYVLTYIMTNHNRLGKSLGDFLNKEMTPTLVSDLKKKKVESTPYVNAWGETPDARGFAQFDDSPRYATGYTSLFNSVGFVVETHMLKKYDKRVKATYAFMVSALDYAEKNGGEIKARRRENAMEFVPGTKYPLTWTIDSAKVEKLGFLGYEGSYKKSDVTTGDRLFYDRKKPYKKTIPFYKEYKPVKEVAIPEYYLIPQGWWNVTRLLANNGIESTRIDNDTVIEVESYKIADFKTATNAYEGHYNHRQTKVTTSKVKMNFRAGDYLIPTRQKGVKYLMETLEPEAGDSFFNWNFFDTILQQKEGYSDYVFEDLAAEILKDNPKLKAELDEKRKSDAEFAKNPGAQLDWVYKHSDHYEKAHLQYPVYRIVSP